MVLFRFVLPLEELPILVHLLHGTSSSPLFGSSSYLDSILDVSGYDRSWFRTLVYEEIYVRAWMDTCGAMLEEHSLL